MIRTRRHAFLSGLADVYFSTYLAGSILGLISVVTGRPLAFYLIVAVNLGFIIPVLVYHFAYAKRRQFRTPGERITGRVVIHDNKVMSNPFGKNRFFLFFILIFIVILQGNSWDILSDGMNIPFGSWIATTISLGLVVIGTSKIGQRNPIGIVVLLIPHIWSLISSVIMTSVPGAERPGHYSIDSLVSFSIYYNLVLIALIIGVMVPYFAASKANEKSDRLHDLHSKELQED